MDGMGWRVISTSDYLVGNKDPLFHGNILDTTIMYKLHNLVH